MHPIISIFLETADAESAKGFLDFLPAIDPLITIVSGVSILIIVLLIIWFAIKKRGSVQKLFDKKRQIMEELKLAERKFLKRQISEESYKKILKKNQEQLIKIDAALSQRQVKKKKDFQKELTTVQAKERHLMQDLLSQKQGMEKELQLAQRKYLKRQIDEKTYKSILHSDQSKLIELEGKLKTMRSTKSVKDVISELKQKLRDREMQEKKSEEAETERIAREIIEQMQASASRQG